MPSNVLPLHLKQTFLPIFEFSLKVMRAKPGYLLKYFLLYLELPLFCPFLQVDMSKQLFNLQPIINSLNTSIAKQDYSAVSTCMQVVRSSRLTTNSKNSLKTWLSKLSCRLFFELAIFRLASQPAAAAKAFKIVSRQALKNAMYCHLKIYSCTSSGTRILSES